ncbi:MAG: hypothetical protein QOJ59_4932, partial [Thermomicrobiales bacterium]|nr:hypothetical protein [Thermomicrobiales bacterium]
MNVIIEVWIEPSGGDDARRGPSLA